MPLDYEPHGSSSTTTGGATRFEVAVGASPAVLPVGTHTLNIAVATDPGTNNERRHQRDILLSRVGAAAVFSVESGNAGDPVNSRDISVNLAYASGTRTLTYSIVGTESDRGPVSIIAIGAA